MKTSPGSAVSERELAAALVASGRMVCVADIATWRKAGLLPPLASHGLGPGKGKAHCWHEADIVGRAQLIFDSLRQYGRNDLTLLLLFFSGFDVQLPQLRRAWAGRARLRKPPTVRRTGTVGLRLEVGDPLVEMALTVSAAVQTDHHAHMIPLLERALAKLGHTRRGRTGQMCRVILAMEPALEASDLIAAADNSEMVEAQRYLVLGLNFLRGCAEERERGSLTAMFGPTLFAFILTLLRSGQHMAMEHMAMRMNDVRRPVSVRPAAALQVHAAE